MRSEMGNLQWKQCVCVCVSVSVSVERWRGVRPDETGVDDLEMEVRRRWRNGCGARGGENKV